MKYTVVHYTLSADTPVEIKEKDILVGIDTSSNRLIVLRFIRERSVS